MKHEVKIPSVGESINEVYIGRWKKQPGDIVKAGEVLVEIETQKTNFDLAAEHDGRLEIMHSQEGEKVAVGAVVAMIDDSVKSAGTSVSPVAGKTEAGGFAPATTSAAAATPAEFSGLSPAVRRLVAEKNLNPESLQGSGKGGRLTKTDILSGTTSQVGAPTPVAPGRPAATIYTRYPERGEREESATRIRVQIAENLVRAQHTAAILTTFNEIDMSLVLTTRQKYKDAFQKKHGVNLGFAGFFALAAASALKKYPLVNAIFTGDKIIFRDYVDISVAVSTDRGLVVPVLRDVDKMDLAGFEKQLSALSEKAQTGKLSIPEMTGGTFTISNGGVFGSLLSTPILNMPQSGILGLHKTEKRPVVINDEIVIRPMMYVALSYDHRIIDGKDAVQFLVAVKEYIENLNQHIQLEKLL